jgi:hypothetical protein
MAEALKRLVAASMRWRLAVLLLAALLVAASLWGAKRHLAVEMDPVALLSPELEWRSRALALREAFPQLQDTIVAVIRAPTPERAAAVQAQLVQRFDAQGWRVRAPGAEDHLRDNALLLMPTDALERLAEQLTRAQPLLGALVAEPSLARFFGVLARSSQQAGQGAGSEGALNALMRETARILNGPLEGPALSWQRLLMNSGAAMEASALRFVVAEPDLPQREAVAVARDAVSALSATDADIALTGPMPLWVEEIDSAFDGALRAGVLALIAVALLLGLGLRAWQLVIASLLTLLAGLAVTLGLATLTVGRLNLISVGFAALFIGLAIDFAVHLSARLRERLAQGAGADALPQAAASVGGALTLCAASAAAAFFAFTPTAYDGVAELGLIGGMGMIVGWLGALTLLPALLAVLPAVAPPSPRSVALPPALAAPAALGAQHPRAVRLSAVALGLLAALAATRADFDYNPMHLKPAASPGLQAYERLSAGGDSPLHAQLLRSDAAATRETAEALRRLPEVRRVIWLESFLPEDQAAKLAIIEDLRWSVGFALPADPLRLQPPQPQKDLAALRASTGALRQGPSEAGRALGEALADWLGRHEEAAQEALPRLQQRLLGNLPALIAQLKRMLATEGLERSDLPATWQRLWLSPDGAYRLQIEPARDLNDQAQLLAFVEAVRELAPDAVGAPVEYVASARTIMRAFLTAFALALLVIALLLWALLRSAADAARALTPLLLGALLLVAVMGLSGLRFNFANVIVLPLLLGIGVANGVHIIWRTRIDPRGNPVASSAGRAVMISVATTLASFAALWLSEHRGMSSMGALLSIGLALQLLCTFVVLPAIMPQRTNPEP